MKVIPFALASLLFVPLGSALPLDAPDPVDLEPTLARLRDLAEGRATLDLEAFIDDAERSGCATIADLPTDPYVPIGVNCAKITDYIVPVEGCEWNWNATSIKECVGEKFCIDFEFHHVLPNSVFEYVVPTMRGVVFEAGGLFWPASARQPTVTSGTWTVWLVPAGRLDCDPIDRDSQYAPPE